MLSAVVKASQLEGLQRLDAEFYQREYFDLIARLEKASGTPLGNIAEVKKQTFTPNPDKDFDYIEIGGIDPRSGDISPVRVPGSHAPSRAQWIVHKGEVIVSMVRPLRNAVGLISDAEHEAVCSSGFTVFRATAIEPELLFAFLKVPNIAWLLDRYTTATMYPAVPLDDLLNLPIPKLPAATHKAMIKDVQAMQQELAKARLLYREAQELILKYTEWKSLSLERSRSWTATAEESAAAARLDAEHFDPRFGELEDHLKKLGAVPLAGLVAQDIHRGKQPIESPDGPILVLKSRHVGRRLLDIENADKAEKLFWKDNPRAQTRFHDVLVNSTGLGTIGRVNCVLHRERTVVDGHIAVVRVDDWKACDPRYLAVYLNSPIGLMQTEHWMSGSSGQIELSTSGIEKFLILVPDKARQKRVADRLQGAWEAREAAGELLARAVSRIQSVITGGK